jgi:chromate transporter
MLLPGPEAQQLATYIGWLLHGTKGGLVAGICFVLPSVFLLLFLSYVYAVYGRVAVVAGVLAGVKPVVVAIIGEAVVRISKRALQHRWHLWVAGGAFLAMMGFHLPFPVIVLLAGVIGIARSWRQTYEAGATSAIKAESMTRMTLRRRRIGKILLLWAVLWLVPFVLLGVWRGWDSLHSYVYRFFTLAAFVTFGGAYTVLAYVNQAAVHTYGWLTQAQAVDGLALAETTPGPLIMVLQFVGFMAGWNYPEGLASTASAVSAALLTTYATFLPCFFFIFLGAPYIEALRENTILASALSGITAAAVGVILHLAVVFAMAVFWPSGEGVAPDWFAVSLCVVASVALLRFHWDVVWVVLGAALVGLGRTTFVSSW